MGGGGDELGGESEGGGEDVWVDSGDLVDSTNKGLNGRWTTVHIASGLGPLYTVIYLCSM